MANIRLVKPTSITVSQGTLQYVNRIKGLMEYFSGSKVTLDRTLLVLCIVTDYELARRMRALRKNETAQDFVLRRLSEACKDLPKKESEELQGIIQSIREAKAP